MRSKGHLLAFCWRLLAFARIPEMFYSVLLVSVVQCLSAGSASSLGMYSSDLNGSSGSISPLNSLWFWLLGFQSCRWLRLTSHCAYITVYLLWCAEPNGCLCVLCLFFPPDPPLGIFYWIYFEYLLVKILLLH